MRRSAGFTLIELVIVIVILGILGAVAAPKFLDLRGDAYGANIKSLAGSLQSATTLAYTQASLKDVDDDNKVTGYGDVIFKNGYPQAAIGDTGILGTLQSVPSGSADGSTGDYKIDVTPAAGTTPGSVKLSPRQKSDSDCYVTYTEADDTNAAKVEFDATCED
ncbi:MAG: pilus assembly FimT family protein [Oceanisphaera sp.]